MTNDSRLQAVHQSYVEIDIEDLKPPSRILRTIDHAFVSELARSIQHSGLLQPILVRKRDNGYELVFGTHRLEACKKIGMQKIPALVSNLSSDEAFLAQISENIERNVEVDPVEEAKGYRKLVANGWTLNSIGSRIGKSDSYVCQRLAMLDRLDDTLLSKFPFKNKGHLTASHLELLSTIPDKWRQRELVRLVETKRLSVRSLEDLLKGIPFPVDILVENSAGQCYIKIPRDFAKAVNMQVGQHLRLCIRGKKLVLDIPASKRDKRSVRSYIHKPRSILDIPAIT